jgi:hypothetical protein
MRPEDEALLARVPGRRREAVRTALEELERMRGEWAGTPDQKLPPDVRKRGTEAALVVKRATQPPVRMASLAIGLLLTGIGVGLAIYEPVYFYAFSATGEGSVHCLIRERPLGIVPRSVEEVSEVVSASGTVAHESQEETDSSGRSHTVRKTVQTFALRNAEGRTLHEQRLEYVLGANTSDMARRVEVLVREGKPASLVRWATVWPAQLGATLFGFVGLAMLWSVFTDAIAWLSFAPLRWLSTTWLTNFVHALVFATVAVAWGVAAVGGNPPDWLVTALAVGP